MADREIILRFRAVQSGFEVFDEAGRKIDTVEKEAEQASRALGGLSRQSRDSASALIDTQRSYEQVGRALGVVVGGAVAAATYGMVRFATAAVEAAGKAESLQTRLVGLTGNTKAAADEYERMVRLASSTPFDVQGVVEAGVTVRAFGDTNRQTLRSVTDLAAFMGTNVVEAAQAYGRAFAGGAGAADILRERGVLALLSLQTGIEDLTTLSLPEFRRVLLEAMTDPDGKIAGSAERLAQTWEGVTSNASDAFEQLKVAIGETVTQSDLVRDTIQALTRDIGAMTAAIKENRSEGGAGFLAGLRQSLINQGSGAGTAELELLPTLARERVEALRRAGTFDVQGGRARPGEFGPFTGGFSPADGGSSPASFGDLATTPQVGPYARYSPESSRGGTGRYDYFGDAVGPFAPGDPNAPRERASRSVDGASGAARAAERQQAQLEKRTADSLAQQEEVRLALLDAQVAMRERAIKYAEEDLRLAQQSGASQQDQLRLAGRIDELERQRLIATRERIEAELSALEQFGPIVSAEVVRLQTDLETVNQELSRAPDHAARLRREFEQARDVATDLGKEINSSLQRAVDGLLSGGGSFDLGNVLIGTGRALTSSFAGKAIESIDFSSLFKRSGTPSPTSQAPAPSATTAIDPNFVGPPTEAQVKAQQSQASSPSTSGFDSGSLTAAAVSFGATVALDLIFNGPQRYKDLFNTTNTLRTTIDRGDIVYATGGGGLIGGIGRGQAELDPNTAALMDAFGLFQPPTGGTQRAMALQRLFRQLGLPEQRVYRRGGHSGVRGQFLTNSIDDATEAAFAAAGFGGPDLTAQTLDELGYHRNRLGPDGERVPRRPDVIELRDTLRAAARDRPNVEALRTDEALALGVTLTGDTRRGKAVAELLTNNLLLTGVSEQEARRQLLKIAGSQNINLLSGLEEIQRLFLEGKLKDDPTTAANEKLLQLTTSAEGLIGLFQDALPKSIDVRKLVADRTNATTGIDIAAVEAGLRGAVTAVDIRDRIDQNRLLRLDPRLQGTEIKRRIADVDRQLQDEDLTYRQREDLLRKRAEYGFQYAQYADQRYTGSQRTRETEYGYSVSESSAKQLEDLGKDIKEPTEDNSEATRANSKETKDNTSAVRDLTNVLIKGIKTQATLDVHGVEGVDDLAAIEPKVRELLRRLLKEPEFKGAVVGATP